MRTKRFGKRTGHGAHSDEGTTRPNVSAPLRDAGKHRRRPRSSQDTPLSAKSLRARDTSKRNTPEGRTTTTKLRAEGSNETEARENTRRKQTAVSPRAQGTRRRGAPKKRKEHRKPRLRRKRRPPVAGGNKDAEPCDNPKDANTKEVTKRNKN